MAELLLLGTGAALNDGSREPTMLALAGPRSTVLIDCGGNAVRQLQLLHVPLTSVECVILTHAHPDHTSGFPLLVEMLWLAGWRGTLPVHGPAEAVGAVSRAFKQWDTSRWTDLPALAWHIVPPAQGAPIALGADFELSAAPGVHAGNEVIAVRARARDTGRTVVYSADGEPSPGVAGLAAGADILVHEATGEGYGHSTAEGAARLAREAGAAELILVHLAPDKIDLAAAAAAARGIFPGPVVVGEDLQRFMF
ncbi:MAG TPA: MBL fold metallo-hydrolase [Anaerolineae bacterium]